VHYLRYALSEKGISASPDKQTAVRQYPVPKSVKDVRAFLGLASFYRMLVPNFAEIAKPLTAQNIEDREFTSGTQRQGAFQSMKDRLRTTTVLAYPNFDLPFIVTTDASKVAMPPSCRKYDAEKNGRSRTQLGSLTQRNRLMRFPNKKC